MPDRYEGRPFLKLVDSFVLDCMGELDASQAFLLDQCCQPCKPPLITVVHGKKL